MCNAFNIVTMEVLKRRGDILSETKCDLLLILSVTKIVVT